MAETPYSKHSTNCKGLPCNCEKNEILGYTMAALIAVITSPLEFWISVKLANSNVVQADALHAFSNGLTNSTAALLGLLIKKRHLSTKSAIRLQARSSLCLNIPFLSISLIYISLEAINKLTNPSPITSHYMFVAALLGFMSNISVAFILNLREITREHDAHHWSSLYVWQNATVSAIIMFSSLFVNLSTLTDPILTLMVGVLIFWKSGKLFFTETTKNL